MPFVPITSLRLALVAVVLASFGALGVLWAADEMASGSAPVEIAVQPVPLDPRAPQVHRVGRLAYAGGLALTARAEGFGGFSALAHDPATGDLIALSDRGRWLAMTPRWRDGRLVGAKAAGALRPLIGADGKALSGRAADAESLAVTDTALVVAFEQDHRLLAYPRRPGAPLADALAHRPEPWPLPDAVGDLAANAGLEAVSGLGDGRVVALAEGRRDDTGAYGGWLVDRDGSARAVAVARQGQHRPTGLDRLPGGDLVMSLRHFSPLSGVSIQVARLSAGALASAAIVAPEPLATLGPRMTVDNIEGIAVAPHGDGVRLYLIADDNFNALQRTLLLAFTLDDAGAAPADGG
ncbi:hypothetical protein EV659_10844 [Rhodothalassium salexigens DSM 2132]|uniref:Phytase-like domain-containing protein n=1 Tax=Rhodothalassium salexigens DSM 2132 TaxID=1188247 RepID=A0A4R2PG74_RHOSA|nr:esterase-like activity of phytase family protein [Rhodothalassium salexigens]MBB4212070.1 hypothetical protein [Rhodothalassium salexigens DSM 2132]TCP32945.1 hypothetical protein EV659_10844 [Rhodothalassium salexigens DSM 2132]